MGHPPPRCGHGACAPRRAGQGRWSRPFPPGRCARTWPPWKRLSTIWRPRVMSCWSSDMSWSASIARQRPFWDLLDCAATLRGAWKDGRRRKGEGGRRGGGPGRGHHADCGASGPEAAHRGAPRRARDAPRKPSHCARPAIEATVIKVAHAAIARGQRDTGRADAGTASSDRAPSQQPWRRGGRPRPAGRWHCENWGWKRVRAAPMGCHRARQPPLDRVRRDRHLTCETAAFWRL
jgi:hypothetical protein